VDNDLVVATRRSGGTNPPEVIRYTTFGLESPGTSCPTAALSRCDCQCRKIWSLAVIPSTTHRTVTMSRIHIVGDGEVVCLIPVGRHCQPALMNKTSQNSHLGLHQMKLPIRECA